MNSYLSVEDLNTMNCALEGSNLVGIMKRKFNLEPNIDCDCH